MITILSIYYFIFSCQYKNYYRKRTKIMLKLKQVIFMNNKGFTLVEMLAVVVVLSVVLGIATNGVLSYIEASKKKSEVVFITNLEKYIENYLDFYKTELSLTNNSYIFKKCKKSNNENCIEVSAYELTSFTITDMTEAEIKLVENNELINPANKKQCFENTNPSIKVYKDDDYVYYYYLDLENNNDCQLSSNNFIITNIPQNLCQKINEGGTNLKCLS